MARRKSSRGGEARKSPGKRGGKKIAAKSGSPAADQTAERLEESDEIQSASEAWLTIEVDESAIQTVEEPPVDDSNLLWEEAARLKASENGGGETGPGNTEPPDAGFPPGIAFPTEEDYGRAVGALGSAPADCVDFLCFGVAEETFAIDIRHVKEIIRARPATELPGAPEFIVGIISLRGQIVPVMDLGRRLGFDPAESPLSSARIVVAAIDEKPVGILVDAVTHKVSVPKSGVATPPAVLGSAEAGFLQGVFRDQGRLVSVLKPERVLAIGAPAAGAARDEQAVGEPA